MENNVQTTSRNDYTEHVPGAYQGIPDTPKDISESLVVRTMKGDLANAIKTQNETLVSIALAEEKKQAVRRSESAAMPERMAQAIEAPAPKRIGRLVVVGAVLLMISVLGLTYKFLLPKLKLLNLPSSSPATFENTNTGNTPVAPMAFAPSLIPAHSEKRFNISKETSEKIFSDIAVARTVSSSAGKIKNLYITEDITTADGATKNIPIPSNRLLILAGISAPEILTRSLEAPFMAGILSEESSTTATPFLILKVSGYETSFAGMLMWERSLPLLIDTVFGNNIRASILDDTKTRDVVLLGRDARVLEIAPNVGIAYAFADQQTIIIAGSQTALEHLLSLVK